MPVCLEDRDPRDLVPHLRNSNLHSAEQIDEIRRSIRRFGFVRPVVVNGSGTILAGHGAVLAALAEDLESIPCSVTTGLSAEEERAYVIADNRIAEKSKWDWDLLATEIDDLVHGPAEIDLGDIGFAEWSQGSAVRGRGSTEIDETNLGGKTKCPKCSFEFDP